MQCYNSDRVWHLYKDRNFHPTLYLILIFSFVLVRAGYDIIKLNVSSFKFKQWLPATEQILILILIYSAVEGYKYYQNKQRIYFDEMFNWLCTLPVFITVTHSPTKAYVLKTNFGYNLT